MKPVALVADLEFYPTDSVEKLKKSFEVISSNAKSEHELFEELNKSNAQVYFCGLGIFIGANVLDESKSLEYLVSPATGVTHLDLEYIHSRKISLIKLGAMKSQIENVFATAELAWGLIITCSRHLSSAVNSVKEGNFDRSRFLGRELFAKTLGVIGFGRLGRQVAKYRSAFGMNVVVFEIDRARQKDISPFQKADSLEGLLKVSDAISVHIPLNEQNRNLINAEMISRIKNGAIFVNTSRGELVDEQALASALRNGKLYGVGVDVLSGESEDQFDLDHSPLVSASREGLNAVITPHIGGWAEDAVELTRTIMVEEFLGKYEH